MDIPKLVDSCCAYIAILFKSSTDKELAGRFGADMTITPAEEEELKQEYAWVLDIDKNRYQEMKSLDSQR
jgi:hypothetical protein